jgi:hypothetical protein
MVPGILNAIEGSEFMPGVEHRRIENTMGVVAEQILASFFGQGLPSTRGTVLGEGRV